MMSTIKCLNALCVCAILAAVCVAYGETPAEKIAAFEANLSKAVESSDKINADVKTFTVEKLLPLCQNKVFVAETTAQNAQKVSLDEIKKIDKEWQDAEDELPIQAEKTGNKCAKEIIKVLKGLGVVTEAFVMDNQGAVVGENTITSDYWQGDEAKWQKSFAKGKGGLDIGKAKLDKSTDTVLQQISLPILDAKGSVIGAVTFGVQVSKFEK